VAAASILVRFMDGDTVVHEYRRSTTLHSEGGIQRMAEQAMGWMQAYACQVTNQQWLKDAERAREHKAA
jgi:hypothetical protein